MSNYDDWETWANRSTSTPDIGEIKRLRIAIADAGGETPSDTHSGRAISVERADGVHVKVNRQECQRKTLVGFPIPKRALGYRDPSPHPVEVCINCDAVHLWPNAKELLS